MIRRAPRDGDFTIINNGMIRDRRLSPKARFLMTFVLQLPDDWEFSCGGLCAATGMKTAMLRSAIAELKKYGYVKITKRPSAEHDSSFKYEYEWYEIPDVCFSDSERLDSERLDNERLDNERLDSESPDSESPDSESPDNEKHTTIVSTNIPSTNRLSTNIPSTKREGSCGTLPRNLYGIYGNIPLSEDELRQLREEFPNDWQARIDRISEYCETHGKRYSNCLATIRSWAKQDRAKERPQPKHRRTEAERNDPNYELF